MNSISNGARDFILYLCLYIHLCDRHPISGVMAFVSMTSHLSKADKIYVAKRSVLVACVIAIIFSVLGDIILNLFNITADSLRVAAAYCFSL